MPYARPPAPPPSLPKSTWRHHILFRHPGYNDSNNVLFRLYALDTATVGSHHGEEESRQRPATPGLYAQFALDACAILAGNRLNGWLSTSRNPDEARDSRVDAGSLLLARSYYYHLDRDDDLDGPHGPYRIVPNFREWRFPHENIPAHWEQLPANPTSQDSSFTPSNLSTALQIRDGSCRISGSREELQVAHIVPQAERDWWKANSMSRYNRSLTSSMDVTSNAMLLQATLHIAFDRPRFVFVPKPSANESGMRLVLHMLEPSPEFEHLYHNRELHQSDVGVEVLFARFAWSLFPLLESFLAGQVDRRLTVRTTSHGQLLNYGYFSAAACERFSLSTRKRSVSPKKRKTDEGAIDSHGGSDVDVDVDEPLPPSEDTHPSAFAPTLRKPSIGCIDHYPLSPCPTPASNKRKASQTTKPSPSSSPSPTQCSPHSRDDAEPSRKRVSTASQLARDWLEKERARSDPHQTWTEERNWLREVWAGKRSLASYELARFWELNGYEVRDEECDDEG